MRDSNFLNRMFLKSSVLCELTLHALKYLYVFFVFKLYWKITLRLGLHLLCEKKKKKKKGKWEKNVYSFFSWFRGRILKANFTHHWWTLTSDIWLNILLCEMCFWGYLLSLSVLRNKQISKPLRKGRKCFFSTLYHIHYKDFTFIFIVYQILCSHLYMSKFDYGAISKVQCPKKNC